MLVNSDARNLPLASESVQCVVTSPPYFGLRDYGTATWEGGDAECEHNPQRPDGGDRADRTLPLGRGGMYRDICPKCGAIRIDKQIGLEQTPEEYVSQMVDVFRGLWRVLKPDGVAWLNLGDSYAGSQQTGGTNSISGNGKSQPHCKHDKSITNMKPKDLIGIPWRVALALQADGCADRKAVEVIDRFRSKLLSEYDDNIPDRVLSILESMDMEYQEAKGTSWWLRQDIIWSKPNPMPESVTDRCTKAHEYIFLLTKSAKYYYDHKAILEPAAYDGRKDTRYKGGDKDVSCFEHERWPNKTRGFKTKEQIDNPQHHGKDIVSSYGLSGNGFKGHSGNLDAEGNLLCHDIDGVPARNKRSVWTVSTSPYRGAHYATFPPKLVEPCILAGSRPGDIVFDPFAGTSTVGVVCLWHRRRYVGGELGWHNIELSRERLRSQMGMGI